MLAATLRYSTFALTLCATLSACEAESSEPGSCGSSTSAVAQGVRVQAYLVQGAWDDPDASDRSRDTMVDCATFTVTQPGTDWQLVRTTPSEVDLAPGTYEVELDWADGDCLYSSEPAVVEVESELEDLVVPLCLDMTGDWTCSMDGEQWTESASMLDACTVEFEGLGVRSRINGHVMEGAELQGVVGPRGRELRSQLREGSELSCTRGEG